MYKRHYKVFEAFCDKRSVSFTTMECFLHGKTAACSTTKHDTFWFCEERPSCEFFCSDEDCYMYTEAVAAFRESGCLHPVCPTHQKLAKLRMVEDKMKQSYGRPFFVCAERENQCKFWQWGDVYECPRPLCQHGMVCCERKVKKDGPNQNRLFYCCPKEDACGFFEWKQQGTRAIKTGFALFSNPLQYRYKIEETGETFTSTKANTKDAFEEYKFLKSVDALTSELELS